ncbi:CTR type copper ion transporter [Haematococcus lacustris]
MHSEQMSCSRRCRTLACLVACLVAATDAQLSCPFTAPPLTAGQLASICATWPTSAAPACSLQRLCAFNVRPPVFPTLCNTSRLAANLCLDDIAVASAVPECNSLQAQRTFIRSNPGCVQALGLLSISSTATTLQNTRAACDAMDDMPMDGCDTCPAMDDCPDPLGSLAAGCVEMRMTPCRTSGWTAFCSDPAQGGLGGFGRAAAHLCLAPSLWPTVRAPPSLPPPPPVAPPPPPPSPASCLSSPSLPSCATYTYPAVNVSADIAKLCEAMPDMPGCSIQAACQAGTVPASSSACVPFTLLATLCTDMPGMNGCGPWKALCLPAASQVQQCRTYPPIPSAPSWAASRQAVFSACGEMGMPQCEQCRQASCPDPLAALAGMCIDMPTMSQCGVYASWCVAANTDGSLGMYCKGAQPGDVGLPSMLMYFHERIRELVLWRTWVPNTQGQYAGTIICIMCFGVVSMGLKTWVTLLNMDWKVRWLATGMPLSKHWLLPSKQQLGHACIKAVIMGVSITLDYFNMLIAMTFNVGMFCAVVLGYVLGVFFFSHIPDNWAARQLHAKQAADRQRMYGEPRDVEVHMQPSPSGSWKAMQDGQDMSDTKEGNMPSCCPGHP